MAEKRPTLSAKPTSIAGRLIRVPKHKIPGLTLPEATVEPADANTEPPFVAIFGRRSGENFVEVLGVGDLGDKALVLPSEDVNALLAAGATPTSVGIAWMTGNLEHVEMIPVVAFGARNGANGQPDPTMWALELQRESKAFVSSIPDGVSPASAWCFLFPWVSFCQQK
ncbi:MAG: hypothetical protein WAS07_15020 [Micropruina sp.]|nr:hypothetical protein [Micropruina sp.]